MPVDSTAVRGRRKLRFNSFDEIIADAEELVASPDTVTLGRWPLNQLLAHWTKTVNCSIDGMPGQAPRYLRLIGPLVKRRILKEGMAPGFKLPKEREALLFPIVESPQEALDQMKAAVARLQFEKMKASHPLFGKLTHAEWIQLHLRHAELHFSFAVS